MNPQAAFGSQAACGLRPKICLGLSQQSCELEPQSDFSWVWLWHAALDPP